MKTGYPGQVPSGVRSLIAPLLSWRERRFAAALCRELVRLHELAVAARPGLDRRAIYEKVVAAHTGADAKAAAAVVDAAEQSFASWPSGRPVNLRDVAHYLAVSEFLACHQGEHWIHANLKHVVDASISHDL
jgi:hypothetical protein